MILQGVVRASGSLYFSPVSPKYRMSLLQGGETCALDLGTHNDSDLCAATSMIYV